MKRTKFDPTKPVATRDGRPARIIATDAKLDGGESIVALVMNDDGSEWMESYQKDGRWVDWDRNDKDLVNAPERVVEFLNVYPEVREVYSYDTKADAAQYAQTDQPDRLLIKVTREDGKAVSAGLA